jgi:hypothetical protein
MKNITENSNIPHRLASNIYPIGESNEVKAQIQKAKKGKVGNTHSIVHNIIHK